MCGVVCSFQPTGLQAELCATQIDDNYVRKKLKLVEDEKDDLRQRYNEWEDEYKRKYGNLHILKKLDSVKFYEFSIQTN